MRMTTITDPKIRPDVAAALVNPEAYAGQRIHETYRWLRAHNPLGIAEVPGFDPFWAVTTYADVQFISRSNNLFRNGDRSALIVNQASDRLTRQVKDGSPHILRSLVQLDGNEHLRAREITQGWFTPSNLQRLERKIRDLAREAVAKMMSGSGTCDFVKEIALSYPLRVIMEVLGVPEHNESLMLKITQEIFGPQDPDMAPAVDPTRASERLSLALQASAEIVAGLFFPLAAERRKDPRDDLISLIANAKIDGKPLGSNEELAYYTIIATAGHDTTSSSIAGAIWALCENQEEFAKVRRNPGLIPNLIEEAIRWISPVKNFMRTATADTEISGRKIAKGDWLMLCYASANRDESVFPDPYSFRVDRPGLSKHLAFGGGGAHLCLGQYLARLEMRVLFEELLPKLASLELDGLPRMSEAIFVNGPKSLPIRFKPV